MYPFASPKNRRLFSTVCRKTILIQCNHCTCAKEIYAVKNLILKKQLTRNHTGIYKSKLAVLAANMESHHHEMDGGTS